MKMNNPFADPNVETALNNSDPISDINSSENSNSSSRDISDELGVTAVDQQQEEMQKALTPEERAECEQYFQTAKKIGAGLISVIPPTYDFFDKFISIAYSIWKWTSGTQPVVAFSVGLYLAFCQAALQAIYVSLPAYKKMTGSNSGGDLEEGGIKGEKEKGLIGSTLDQIVAGMIVSAYVGAGLQFSAQTLVLLTKIFGAGNVATIGSIIGFLNKSTNVRNAEGFKSWQEYQKQTNASSFEKTLPGYLFSAMHRYIGVINLNNVTTNLQPSIESSLHAAAVYQFAVQIGVPEQVAITMGIIASSGQYYHEKYDQAIMRQACRAMGVSQDYVIEHVWTKAARFYDQHIASLQSGKVLTDVIGIAVPPALLQGTLKTFSSATNGYATSSEFVKEFPKLWNSIFKNYPLPNLVEYSKWVELVCSITAGLQGLTEWYTRSSSPQSGLKAITDRYNGADIKSWGKEAMNQRKVGYWEATTNYMESWKQTFWCTNERNHEAPAEDYTAINIIPNNE